MAIRTRSSVCFQLLPCSLLLSYCSRCELDTVLFHFGKSVHERAFGQYSLGSAGLLRSSTAARSRHRLNDFLNFRGKCLCYVSGANRGGNIISPRTTYVYKANVYTMQRSFTSIGEFLSVTHCVQLIVWNLSQKIKRPFWLNGPYLYINKRNICSDLNLFYPTRYCTLYMYWYFYQNGSTSSWANRNNNNGYIGPENLLIAKSWRSVVWLIRTKAEHLARCMLR